MGAGDGGQEEILIPVAGLWIYLLDACSTPYVTSLVPPAHAPEVALPSEVAQQLPPFHSLPLSLQPFL